jgi:hypothetical protein
MGVLDRGAIATGPPPPDGVPTDAPPGPTGAPTTAPREPPPGPRPRDVLAAVRGRPATREVGAAPTGTDEFPVCRASWWS